MACLLPLKAHKTETGQVLVSKRARENEVPPGLKTDRFEVACGRCIGCRIDMTRDWTVRCYHEARLHERNSFITLTYDQDHLPKDWSLDRGAPRAFLKRFRNYHRNDLINIRYFGCGEYGDLNKRPHYHMIIFGYDFPDRTLWKTGDHELYISEELTKLWPYGYSTIGNFTIETAAYTASYITKKLTGDALKATGSDGLKPYELYDDKTGEIHQRIPEFAYMSNRPGIGHGWITKYYKDCYPKDYLSVNGKRVRPSRYYDRYIEKHHPNLYEQVRTDRKNRSKDRLSRETERKTLQSVLKEATERNKRMLAVKQIIGKAIIKDYG